MTAHTPPHNWAPKMAATPYSEARVDDGAKGCRHERGLDEQDSISQGKTRSAGDDDSRCNAADDHSYDVLQRQWQCRGKGWNTIERKE